MNSIREYKKSLPKIHTVIAKEKNEILKYENAAVNENERLRILRTIFSRPIIYFTLKTNRRFIGSDKKIDFTTTRDYILNSKWL